MSTPKRELVPVTFAAELRAAAMELRDDWKNPAPLVRPECSCSWCRSAAINLALADWLDHTAALIEGNKGAIEGVQSSGMALLTARAINGGAS